jgi:hypothetical protein
MVLTGKLSIWFFLTIELQDLMITSRLRPELMLSRQLLGHPKIEGRQNTGKPVQPSGLFPKIGNQLTY